MDYSCIAAGAAAAETDFRRHSLHTMQSVIAMGKLKKQQAVHAHTQATKMTVTTRTATTTTCQQCCNSSQTATGSIQQQQQQQQQRQQAFHRRLPLPLLLLPTLAVACLSLSPICCFNLEQRLPIVKYGPHVNSHFGYSLATHSIDVFPNNTIKCVLVGAPLDHNLQPGTNASGALWKCPITQRHDDCEQVITDGRKSPEGAYDSTYDSDNLTAPAADEIKEGQWMGVTVRSQGVNSMVLVCAHRYVNIVRENRYGQGLCYVLTNNLKLDEAYEPCKGRSVQRQHEDYGFCQAGTSGVLLDDSMVLGSPGPFTWRGTIFITEITGDYLHRDKTMYYSDHSDASSPVDKYSYLGMAVTGGRYFSERMSYAAGAPRSNGHGQVIIFDKATTSPIPVRLTIDGEQFGSSFGYELATADVNGDRKPDIIVAAPLYFTKSEGGAVYVYQNEKDMLPTKPTLKLTGALESRFGLAVANIGDLNKDGCDDLAVGAPYEGNGAVYIYLGSPHGLNDKPAQRIQAEDLGGALPRPISTFGISIAGNLDLDGNSYTDLAVGAMKSGAAVILLGRPIISIQTEYRSKELRNIDPSRQGCLTDAFTNSTCFTFEACCSIDSYEHAGGSKELKLFYTVEAETFDNNKKFSRVFFDRENKGSNIIRQEVSVRTDGRPACQRVTCYIKENTRDIQTPIGFRLTYSIDEPPLADSALTRLNPILDKTQAAIDFEGTFQKDCGDDDKCESNLLLEVGAQLNEDEAAPGDENVLVLDEKKKIRINVNVSNLADSAYETQLFIVHQQNVSYISASKTNNAICNRFNDTLVACSLGNPMRRGSSTHFFIRFDPSDLGQNETQLTFNIFVNTTSTLIGDQPTERTLNVRVVKRAELSLRGWANPEQSFYSTVKLDDSPMTLSDVGTPLTHIFSVYNNGPWRAPMVLLTIYWPLKLNSESGRALGDQYLLYLEDVPTIENIEGQCTVAPEHVNPLKLKPKSDRLQGGALEAYMMAPSPMLMRPSLQSAHFGMSLNKSQSGKSAHGARQREAAAAAAAAAAESANRVRRNTLERIIRPERFMDGRDANGKHKKQEIVELSCNKPNVYCIKIQCEMYDMQVDAEAQVLVRARLWNSTLVLEHSRVDRVRIMSAAHAKLPPDFGVEQLDNNDDIIVETHAYPELMDQQRDAPTPWTIIILAVVGGLLLLSIVIFCLWRCGFFKRQRITDPTLSGNLEKMNEEKPFLGAKSNHAVF